MLTFHWLLTVVALAVAAVALAKARRATKRLERLTETYWELRYDHGQLRALVARLDPAAAEPAEAQPAAKPAGTNFISLSSLKK